MPRAARGDLGVHQRPSTDPGAPYKERHKGLPAEASRLSDWRVGHRADLGSDVTRQARIPDRLRPAPGAIGLFSPDLEEVTLVGNRPRSTDRAQRDRIGPADVREAVSTVDHVARQLIRDQLLNPPEPCLDGVASLMGLLMRRYAHGVLRERLHYKRPVSGSHRVYVRIRGGPTAATSS